MKQFKKMTAILGLTAMYMGATAFATPPEADSEVLEFMVEEAQETMTEDHLVLSLQNCQTITGTRTMFLELYWAYSDTEMDTYGNPKAIRYVKRSRSYNDYPNQAFPLDTNEYVIRKVYSVGAAENSSIGGAAIASPHFSIGIHEFKWDGRYGGDKFDMDMIKRGIFRKRFVGEINAGGLGGTNLSFDCEVPYQAFKK